MYVVRHHLVVAYKFWAKLRAMLTMSHAKPAYVTAYASSRTSLPLAAPT
jgi:hypothetical protein